MKPYPTGHNMTVEQGKREVNAGFGPKIKLLRVQLQD